jgi:hypothetical protein
VFDQPQVFGYYLSAYRDLKRGILPEAGSRMDQSAYVMEVLSIIDGVYAEVTEELMARAEQNAGRQAGQQAGPRGKMHSRSS